MRTLDLAPYVSAVEQATPFRRGGRVMQAVGLSIEVEGLPLQVGEICHVFPHTDPGCVPSGALSSAPGRISGEVVGFRGERLIVMPFSETNGVRMGSLVYQGRRLFTVPVGEAILGRVIDGLCRPIDGNGPIQTSEQTTLGNAAPSPLGRRRISSPLETGVRAIDGLITCGKGQRIGIFAGSGVGKSTVLGMIARNALSDVNVIALIGERGREVQEFVERDLGPEGLRRSVVVVSTSDQPPLQRLKGAWVATAIAEYFRDQGRDVTLLMDSVTRFAMAQREIGLAAGEPPTTRGYPPSVFALLPKLMERAGTSDRGTITGFYTVLVEGDDLSEPVTDTARSILDGHIVLSRRLANDNHYPAIDVLASVSRVMPAITSTSHRETASRLRDVLATYNSAADLINIGAYAAGSNPAIDQAIRLMPGVRALLRQGADEQTSLEETVAAMESILAASEGSVGSR